MAKVDKKDVYWIGAVLAVGLIGIAAVMGVARSADNKLAAEVAAKDEAIAANKEVIRLLSKILDLRPPRHSDQEMVLFEQALEASERAKKAEGK